MSTITTRFLIISDTHEFKLGASKLGRPFHLPVPKADVILHCGDLTNSGSPAGYKSTLTMLAAMDAELKLVIAGNHDVTLDSEYWARMVSQEAEALGEDENESESRLSMGDHTAALALMTGPTATSAGVTYLHEGTHAFTLSNGAHFTVYASPYSPEFCDWAFAYERHEDRYSLSKHIPTGAGISIATNPIPDFPLVDIVMTHGPPKELGELDVCSDGSVGCAHLVRAIARARPRIHCFGHIHEGYGAKLIEWTADGNVAKARVKKDFGALSERTNYPEAIKPAVRFGQETLLVNAAIRNRNMIPRNAPWLVDVELEKAT